MDTLPLRFSLLALGVAFALQAEAAAPTLAVYLYEGSTPVDSLAVQVDGAAGGQPVPGGVLWQPAAGRHAIRLLREDKEVLAFDLELQEDEQVQVSAALYPGRAPVYRLVSSLSGERTVDTGATPAGAMAGASPRAAAGAIANAGLAAGPGGDAAGSVQTLRSIDVRSVREKGSDNTGDQAAAVEERRETAQVTEVLSQEQIARAGDSDAADALKRVTGLTLVDRRYVYTRGLGERYSSVLLNGAQIPSPDPTRRVVPLDLFPTEILDGMAVQKTYSADLPGDFGGGTIELRTRGVPEGFLLRVQGTLGYVDGTTGREALRYAGGARDWTGFHDCARAAPDGLLDPMFPSDPAQREALGEALAAKGYSLHRNDAGPDTGFGLAVGDDLEFGDGAWSLGYLGGLRYSQEWDVRDEKRKVYGLSQGRLVASQDFRREKSERAIDGSAFFTTGARIGEHHELSALVMQLRQTTDEARIDEGLLDSGNLDREYQLRWTENELTTRQLGGAHLFPALHGLGIDWRWTDSTATREAPNTREYRFSYDENVDAFVSEFFNVQRFEQLADDAEESRIDLSLPFEFADGRSLMLHAGASRLRRERDSGIRRFTFFGARPPGAILDLEDLLTPGNIRPGGQVLTEATLATDAYVATQDLDAVYAALDARRDAWRLNLGVRREDVRQEVITRRPFDPTGAALVGLIDESDTLPAGSLTWSYSEQAQLRLAYGRSVSRPDLREQSPADFIEPQLDIRVQGNPDLEQAGIEHLDLRWEYYFTPSESLSVAYFQKEFTHPIELVGVPASGDLLQIRNADRAENRGIELDYFRYLDFAAEWGWGDIAWENFFVGANYAWIDSEVELGASRGIQTNATRPLQGQSKFVANLQAGYVDPENGLEATLLYNVFGERISQVGVDGLPDTYEQPFHQLDFTLSTNLPWENWRLKLRLRNLLDDASEFTAGDQVARRFRKGREAAVTLEWRY